ncbi:hypothetical protein PsorP6_017795 [Peronosclerospora sorghi]|uniref:Uncharacterized protein n=1 Tax=Peronosclerospora sorghi TaxID=230839 RepID=A0ACC0WKT1_9STRA|nr:hypothetical protein PsorP6_017795 [Peronosclerospora sorghi]
MLSARLLHYVATASSTAAHTRVKIPKPLASDVEAIEELYSKGTPWSEIATNITQARPYQLPRARYALVLETGASSSKTDPMKLLQSFVRDHNNPVLAELLQDNLVGQLSKLPGGNLRLREFDVFDEKYYLVISSIDSDLNTDAMMQRLYELGCRPLYDTLLTPPFSPPRRITPPPADTAIVVLLKNKCTRNSDDFANLTSKERPKDTTGITTSNYFSVLSQIEAEFDLVEAPLGVEAKPSFQIKPTIALKSTEASPFLTKHHTKVVKTTQPITVAETAESMIGDTSDVELDLLPDRMVMAATRIPSDIRRSSQQPIRIE